MPVRSAAIALLLAAAQDVPVPAPAPDLSLTPAEITLPLDRNARIASMERIQAMWPRSDVTLSPAMKRLIATEFADASFRGEREQGERNALRIEVDGSVSAKPFSASAFLRALDRLDAFDRAHPDAKVGLIARIIRAAPATERARVARYLAQSIADRAPISEPLAAPTGPDDD